jgi:hypothetical protein
LLSGKLCNLCVSATIIMYALLAGLCVTAVAGGMRCLEPAAKGADDAAFRGEAILRRGGSPWAPGQARTRGWARRFGVLWSVPSHANGVGYWHVMEVQTGLSGWRGRMGAGADRRAVSSVPAAARKVASASR